MFLYPHMNTGYFVYCYLSAYLLSASLSRFESMSLAKLKTNVRLSESDHIIVISIMQGKMIKILVLTK